MSLSHQLAGAVRRVRGSALARGHNRRMAGTRLIRAFADAYPDACFVEVGANDGERWDHLEPHIRRGRWRGVMAEPVPYVFARLQANYGDLPGVALENVAVAEQAGRLPFYHLAEAPHRERQGLPEYYDGLGSFRLETLLTHKQKIPDFDRRLVQTEVEAITFSQLCGRNGLHVVDLVVVDTEGYDAVVVRDVRRSGYRPRILVFEHFHLTEAERGELRASFAGDGYALVEEGFDTFCVDVCPADALTKLARSVRPAVRAITSRNEHAA